MDDNFILTEEAFKESKELALKILVAVTIASLKKLLKNGGY